MVNNFFADREKETPAPKVKIVKAKDGSNALSNGHRDDTVDYALMAKALGTADADFIYPMISQLASVTGKGQDANEEFINFVLSVISGTAPRDRVEAMLAAQMAVVHLATMTFTRRLAHVDNIQQQDSAQNALNKLMRTFTNQMETLKRYRSGAQQTVKVEHVHVHEGGQAIVGNVEARVGVATKAEEQTHAKAIAHAPEPEMRSALQAERETVPVAGDEER